MTTSTPPPGDAGTDVPPADPHGRRGLGPVSEVRRSRDDRMLAGVCGGLARRFDVDPVLVRVLAVVLCFVGLAGLILYVAAWLLLPADGEPRSHAGDWFGLDSPQARDVGLLVAGVLALLAVVGDGGWGTDGGWLFWPVLVLAGPVAFVLWLSRRRRTRGSVGHDGVGTTTTDPTPDHPAPSGAPATSSVAAPDDTVTLTGPSAGGPPADVPPAPPTATRPAAPWPPAPPREPFSWLPTLVALSTTAIVLAVLRLTEDPAWPAYVAAALAVVGVTLLGSSLTRGGGPLILAGLLLLPVLAVGTVVPNLEGDDRTVAPSTAAQVASSYEQGFGRFVLDLDDVADPEQLAGRRIDVETGAGETVVVVPDGLPVVVEASVRAGDLDVLGERSDGVARRVVTDAADGLDADSADVLRIEVDHGLGRVEVRTR
jgi:phage shock protein PspC (stress-responsive transcriptional regulator)